MPGADCRIVTGFVRQTSSEKVLDRHGGGDSFIPIRPNFAGDGHGHRPRRDALQPTEAPVGKTSHHQDLVWLDNDARAETAKIPPAAGYRGGAWRAVSAAPVNNHSSGSLLSPDRKHLPCSPTCAAATPCTRGAGIDARSAPLRVADGRAKQSA